jgi:hypothetical protein
MHPLEQFARVAWAGFEQLAAAGEAADAHERRQPPAAAEQPKAQAAEPAPPKPPAPKPPAPKPPAPKPEASRRVIDTEGHDL